eukprot:m51a1_g6788 hypothetical protein (653) ;mRNA; f:188234-190726
MDIARADDAAPGDDSRPGDCAGAEEHEGGQSAEGSPVAALAASSNSSGSRGRQAPRTPRGGGRGRGRGWQLLSAVLPGSQGSLSSAPKQQGAEPASSEEGCMVCRRSWQDLGLVGRDPRAHGAHRYWCAKRAGLVGDRIPIKIPKKEEDTVFCDICGETFPRSDFKASISWSWHRRKCMRAHSQQPPQDAANSSPASSAASPSVAPSAPLPLASLLSPAHSAHSPGASSSGLSAPVVPSPVMPAHGASVAGSASTSAVPTPSIKALDPSSPDASALPASADLHLDTMRIVPEEPAATPTPVKAESGKDKEWGTPTGERQKWVCKRCGGDFHHYSKGKFVAHVRYCTGTSTVAAEQRDSAAQQQQQQQQQPQQPALPKVYNTSTEKYYCQHCKTFFPAANFKNRVAFGWHKRRCQGVVHDTAPAFVPAEGYYSSETEDEDSAPAPASADTAQNDQKRPADAAREQAGDASPPQKKKQRVGGRVEIAAGRRRADGSVELQVVEGGKEPRWVSSTELRDNPLLLVEYYESRAELFGPESVQGAMGVSEVVALRKRENGPLEALATTKSNPEGEWVDAEHLSGRCKLCEYYMSHSEQPEVKQESATPSSAGGATPGQNQRSPTPEQEGHRPQESSPSEHEHEHEYEDPYAHVTVHS